MKGIIIAIALVAWLQPAQSRASEGDEVLVIYNSKLPESKAVADHYAARREVPRSQVFGFPMSTAEAISREEYRDTIQTPLLEKLRLTKLWTFGRGTATGTNGETITIRDKLLKSDIRYAVLCYGVPLKIAPDKALTAGTETIRPELRRNEAAVENELAWLPLIYQRLPLTGPMRNFVYGVTNGSDLNPTNGILMVTRLDGPSADIARGLVDKAIEAETDGLWGRAYFDTRSIADPGYKMGDDWIRAAAEICRIAGFETYVDTNADLIPQSFPMSQIGYYCGWYKHAAWGPFSLGEVEFMPGAFAYHIHSFSASSVRDANQAWVAPLLAKGVTATMGCVYEPYLGGTPEIGMFTARFIISHMTYGEAAYASQPVLSWQTTVVGDPLYRPFAKSPQQLHIELAAKNSKLIEWSHLKVVDLGLAKGMPPAQFITYLETVTNTATSAVLSEKLGDLCSQLGKPSSAIYAYEQALKNNPSRQQSIRLRLTLAEKLFAAGKEEEAYQQWKSLLDDRPYYPGRLDVCEKILPLAKKFKKADDVSDIEALIKHLTYVPPPATNSPSAQN